MIILFHIVAVILCFFSAYINYQKKNIGAVAWFMFLVGANFSIVMFFYQGKI